MFLYFEPFAAFGGFLITHFFPVWYLKSLSPSATSSTYSPLDQPVYDQLAAHLLRFAWCEAIVLRITQDLRVWKYVLFGIFLCDLVHLYASYRILGPATFFDPRQWRSDEWLNFLMLYGPATLRLATCLEIGIAPESGPGEQKSKRTTLKAA